MCDHAPNREAAMTIIGPGVWCDPCLVPLVAALNAGGVSTVASCCGHGTHYSTIGLTDGRWLMVLPDTDHLDNRMHPTPGRAAAQKGDGQ